MVVHALNVLEMVPMFPWPCQKELTSLSEETLPPELELGSVLALALGKPCAISSQALVQVLVWEPCEKVSVLGPEAPLSLPALREGPSVLGQVNRVTLPS